MQPLRECSFLIPVTRDGDLSDGRAHEASDWEWLDDQLFALFDGKTMSSNFYEGIYRDPDTGLRVADRSIRYVVAVSDDRIEVLRLILQQACLRFAQKCIYLSIAGNVEFIKP